MAMDPTVRILGELQRRSFTPNEDGDWFDLPVGGSGQPPGIVRVDLDDGMVIVYVLAANMVHLWDAKLSDGTPLSVITTVIDLAIARAYAGH